MATLISTKPKLFFIALFIIVLGVHSQQTRFAYDTFNPKPADLIYQGGAHVPSGYSSLRLTGTDSSGKPQIDSTGRVLYSPPVTFWEGMQQAAFETTIRFTITPSPGGASDGITFFIAPVNTTFDKSSSGGNLGVFDNPTGTKSSLFAVEFDTYDNVYDPNSRHIGFDIESRVSKSTAKFNSATGQLVVATISYDPRTHTITVDASSGTQEPSLTYVHDLKAILPHKVQVGLSTSTGGPAYYLGIADIISWNFTSSFIYDMEETHLHQVV